jgi:hypothetical protein
MKISASESALLNARERDMLKSNGPWHVRDLVSLIKRVRDLRDKQRHINQRSVVASARGPKGKGAAVNARTVKKAALLDKALKYFEGELEAINKQSTAAASALKAANKTAGKASASDKAAAKKPAAKKKTAKKPVAKKPAAKKPAAKKSVAKNPAGKVATAGKPAKSAAAAKPGARKGPKRDISDKARINLPKGGRGDAPSQVASLPSRHKSGRRSR